MRKIYQKYFEIPEENKGIIGERVFFARLTVAIVCIVLCMSAMGFSAYAFFTANVSSSMNQIQAANFDLNVQKIEPQTQASSASYEAEKTYRLKAGSIYKFVLEKHGNASTGYCKIVITPNDVTSKETSEAVFYTQQFGKVVGQEEPINEREITITVGVATTVKFVPCWGTYVGEGVSEVNYAMGVKETTDAEAATQTGTTTPTEVTTSTEDIAPEAEEKKEDTTSAEDVSETKLQE